MKRIIALASVVSLVFLGSYGCGNSATEEAAKQKIEDSVNEIDRNNSLDEADKMLREADSLDKIREDSIAKASKK
jgi:hypothetical protein